MEVSHGCQYKQSKSIIMKTQHDFKRKDQNNNVGHSKSGASNAPESKTNRTPYIVAGVLAALIIAAILIF